MTDDIALNEPESASPARRKRGLGLVLGLLLGAAAAAAAFHFTPRLYRSTSWIEVPPEMPMRLGSREVMRPVPQYDAHAASQAALATSRRVTDMALASPDWRKLRRPATEDEDERFRERLTARRRPRTTYVEISFRDEDPAAAKAGVDAVVESYMKLVYEREVTKDQGRIRMIENRRAVLERQLADLRRSPHALNAEGLAAVPDAATSAEIARLQRQLDEVRDMLDRVNLETHVGSVRVAQMGDTPDAPHRDRRGRNAAYAGAGGFLLGLVLARSLRRR